MIDVPRILAGLAMSTLIGGLAYRRSSLSASGWLGAIITGTLTFGFGGWAWGATLVAFFVSSSALSHFRQAQKQRLAGEKFEKGGQRDLWQTLANGGPGALLALIYGLAGEPLALLLIFAGVMATVTADTWATELGVLSPTPPRMITNGRRVAPGTSGGVTALGMGASLAGALLIGMCLVLLYRIEHSAWVLLLLPAALLGGLVGSLADSLLGATLQAIYRTASGDETERHTDSTGHALVSMRGWRWMNNDMVNLLSSLAGGVAAFALGLVLGG